MKLELTILGSNSAIPGFNRFPSSQVLQTGDAISLIDCGEGAQIKLAQFGIRQSRINCIFVSHLHGDHIFGLPGLLTSWQMGGRTDPVSLFGPPGLEEFIVNILKTTEGELSYELRFHEFQPVRYHRILHDDHFEVYSFPLKHRMPTSAYLFRELPGLRNIRKEAIEKYHLTIEEIVKAKKGKNISRGDGLEINFKDITYPPHKPRSYAYCSDTAYDKSIVPFLTGVDLLYHEATYLHEMVDKATDRYHSTALQAAKIARKAGVGKLVIGHYSSRYKDLNPLLEEAREIFGNTELAIEGRRFEVKRDRTAG